MQFYLRNIIAGILIVIGYYTNINKILGIWGFIIMMVGLFIIKWKKEK